MRQDFETGLAFGRALEQIRSHEARITDLETWRSGLTAQDQPRGRRIALVGAIWTAAAGTAWNAESLAGLLLAWINR